MTTISAFNVSNLRNWLHNVEIGGGGVLRIDSAALLQIPALDGSAYANAQIDSYSRSTPHQFSFKPPLELTLHARFSHNVMHGTSGFGFWNHPFGAQGDVLAPPCNVWFFHASAESNMQVKPGQPGHGFKAATLDSGGWLPRLPGRMMQLANGVASRLMRNTALARLLLRGAQVAVRAHEQVLDHIDRTQWHSYRISWQRDIACFFVDEALVLRAPAPPRNKLGFVAWVDNYRAIAADGQYAFGLLRCDQPQSLELKDIHIHYAEH